MTMRGYNHKSPLDKRKATGDVKQNDYVDSVRSQIQILKKKGCSCKV